MKKSAFKVLGLVIAAAFATIQLWPVARTNPAVTAEISAPSGIMEILRRGCYDCHSNETRWPWYSHVAPLSWFVSGHVSDARAVINFSTWAGTDSMTRAYNRREIFERVSRGEMPLPSYLILHSDARITVEEIALLEKWSNGG